MTNAPVTSHQVIREHLAGHGFEQEQAMALAYVIDGLTADIGAKLEKATSEIRGDFRDLKEDVRHANSELKDDFRDLKEDVRRDLRLTRWVTGLAAGLAAAFAAIATAIAIAAWNHLLSAQP